MAERSIQAGYMKDALKYLQIAEEAGPGDFDVMLKLGWTFNALHEDKQAIPWFDLARRSPDPRIAAEAGHAWHTLHAAQKTFHTSGWLFPLFSTRWHDFFSYGQVRTEVRTGLFFQPYASVRFIGDTRLTIGAASPQSLSESSFVVAAGVHTTPWHKITAWFEAGSAISYVTGHMLPDYRGGISTLRSTGHSLNGESSGWFADSALDAVFVSRFDHDFLIYDQSRFGYTSGPAGLRMQFYWNANVTTDSKRQYWANFVETGPGVRFSSRLLPAAMWITCNVVRGAYMSNADNPRRPNFNDVRFGIWYAFSR
jgi:hypothetical protein